MAKSLLPEERLDLLRGADHERRWHSLDDKRVCIICERVFSGRQIEIREQSPSLTLHCPTEDCPSDFRHWVIWQPKPPAQPASSAAGESEYAFL